jgi:hypothetical protein
MLEALRRYLPPIAGSSDADPDSPEPSPDAADSGDAPASEPEGDAPESFIDPRELPEELKPHWKRMHGAFTKKMQGIRDTQAKVAIVDRFFSDPAFAAQTLETWATQNGYTLTRAGQPGSPPSAASAPSTPAAPEPMVSAVRSALPDELAWLAPAIAASVAKAQEPILRETRARDDRARASEYDELAEELGEQVPGWQSHEEDMTELLGFLQGPALRHRRFGSKLALLHAVVTRDASTIREALRRTAEAGRNRGVAGQAGRATVPNLSERILKAKPNDAWALASEEAIRQLEAQGHKFR